MRVGIFGGAANDGTLGSMTNEASRAEKDGFASFWVPQIFNHDALTALAVIGREVPRIELGTSVVPTYPRHPMMMAQQALTVNAATDGRLCLGIGLSHQMVVEGMWGMSFDKPVRHMREYLEVMMPLLEGKPVAHAGEAFRVNGAVDVPGGSRPGVVVAALGEQMLNVTAALADGTLTWCTGPQTLKNHTIPTIRAAADKHGRDSARVIAALPVCVTKDVAAAQERAAKVFVIYGQLPSYRAMLDKEGAAGPADIAIAGSESEVLDRISALADMGVTDFAAVEFGGTPDEVADTRNALKKLLA
ncbi:MAG: TIGR03564 family F420-dependent LLM class oxidoreductase [Acidimicrobiia bacterium]|jgi:5,10-methylenetetrahydromethanopterin reductase|nr:TIGR03564 family F420-dependent LLM class oxidoreductase [Actinomycetota bacterium]MDA3012167.1 TIGR03564 family F420-dependent LLM class oxidoreductase [Actinomycetota bacterium]MDA3024923.1 TIGR03564 family F420-dependent LLM class oxidoreductase [Actinomycetota bacterium]NBU55620.1 TIGR03564 family F420-dependent LLM class oxidoreductase [Acidimicrobiia bacterium]